MARRLMSDQFTDELNDAVNEYAGQYVTAYATAPGALMGEKMEGGPGVEEIVELTTFGQVLSADGTSVVGEDNDFMVSICRLFIPKEEIPQLIEFFQRAAGSKATDEGWTGGGNNGSAGTPDRD